MSEEKFTVVKFTTHDGKEFYARTSEAEIEDMVREVVEHTRNVYQIDILEMTSAEYSAFPATSEAALFFGDAKTLEEEADG